MVFFLNALLSSLPLSTHPKDLVFSSFTATDYYIIPLFKIGRMEQKVLPFLSKSPEYNLGKFIPKRHWMSYGPSCLM